jgi:hypothetical protein
MNADQLRDSLANHIEWTFPDIPVYLVTNEGAYEIGSIYSSDTRILLLAGEETELSKRMREEAEIDEGSQPPE